MKVKEGMYMKKILEAIKNFFSASHERERKGIQATKHGMFNNFVYAVKLTWQLNNQFIIAMIVMGVLSAVYMLIGIYIPKIVLALVENKVTTDTMIKVLVAVGIIILVVKLINTKAQYVGEYAWDKVYKGLVSKYLRKSFATVYKGNIIKNLIMDCQSYTKYRPNETTGGIFVSWRRKEELPTGA